MNIERGIIIAAVIIVIGAMFSENVWNALTAIGTIGAVVIALYLGPFRDHLKRPILEIDFYEKTHPHLRQVSPYIDGVKQPWSLYSISIRVINVGKTIARNAQVVNTGKWSFESDKWINHPNWIPVSIKWALDEMNPHPSEVKDLISHRPYVFNIGGISSRQPNIFELKALISPSNQPTLYEPGQYCFKVMICAEGIDTPIIKYFYIDWEGGCSNVLKQAEKTIKVEMKDSPPLQDKI